MAKLTYNQHSPVLIQQIDDLLKPAKLTQAEVRMMKIDGTIPKTYRYELKVGRTQDQILHGVGIRGKVTPAWETAVNETNRKCFRLLMGVNGLLDKFPNPQTRSICGFAGGLLMHTLQNIRDSNSAGAT